MLESRPHRSNSNGIAENAVRRVKERTDALVVQSGLSEQWWREAIECFWYFAKHTRQTGRQKVTVCNKLSTPFECPICSFFQKFIQRPCGRVADLGANLYLFKHVLANKASSGAIDIRDRWLKERARECLRTQHDVPHVHGRGLSTVQTVPRDVRSMDHTVMDVSEHDDIAGRSG